jgi:hypothetical protein
MYNGNGANINIGLQNLESFFSNVGGSKVTTVGDVMTKGDGTRVNIASGTQNINNNKGSLAVKVGNVMS